MALAESKNLSSPPLKSTVLSAVFATFNLISFFKMSLLKETFFRFLSFFTNLFTFLFLMLFASFRASYSQIDLIDDPRCVDKNITLCHTGVATKCDQWLSEQVQQLDYGNDYKLAMCSLGLQVVILLYNVGKFIVSRCDDESCIRRVRLSC